MPSLTKRATIYFDPMIHKILKMKAVELNKTISDIVNDAIREELAEDAEDLTAFEERKNEPAVSYENMIKELKRNGKL